MRNTKRVPVKIQKLVFQQANSACSLCPEINVYALEIHHIIARNFNGSNEPENLLVVCANCHSKITYGLIPYSVVIATKAKQYGGANSV